MHSPHHRTASPSPRVPATAAFHLRFHTFRLRFISLRAVGTSCPSRAPVAHRSAHRYTPFNAVDTRNTHSLLRACACNAHAALQHRNIPTPSRSVTPYALPAACLPHTPPHLVPTTCLPCCTFTAHATCLTFAYCTCTCLPPLASSCLLLLLHFALCHCLYCTYLPAHCTPACCLTPATCSATLPPHLPPATHLATASPALFTLRNAPVLAPSFSCLSTAHLPASHCRHRSSMPPFSPFWLFIYAFILPACIFACCLPSALPPSCMAPRPFLACLRLLAAHYATAFTAARTLRCHFLPVWRVRGARCTALLYPRARRDMADACWPAILRSRCNRQRVFAC